MEFQGNILCLTYKEIVPHIMPEGTYKSLKSKGKISSFSRGGGKGNVALIGYESLPVAYQKAVISKYGDPYTYKANEAIADSVQHDFEAEQYYIKFRFDDGTSLPPEHIDKYTTSASWLKMLDELTADKKQIKNKYRLSMGKFWKVLQILLAAKDIDLPKNRIRLQQKIEQYRTCKESDVANEQYDFLIEKFRYGNTNRNKIKDELSEALLLEMLAHPHQHEDVVIQEQYNKWARDNGKPLIKSASTIGNYRRANAWKITQQREGNKVNYEKYGESIGRVRPSAPLFLIESDDNDLDLYYKHVYYLDGKKQTNYYKRFVIMVVKDSYNDYILGYAIGESQTTQLVRDAYLDAMHHIKELTGSFYLPHELKSDRWGLDVQLKNELSMFYKSLGKFTPAKAKNPRSKYIEQSFGKEWHKNLKHFDNYAGHNITAKENLNPDAVAINKKFYPSAEDAAEQIHLFIEMMRQSKNRQQKWLDAFTRNEVSQRKKVNDEQMLLLFGRLSHERGNTLTNKGINIEISGAKYRYEVPEHLYLQYVGIKMNVLYDPYDMSRVLVVGKDDDKVRFVAQEYVNAKSALMDFRTGDGKLLEDKLARKERTMQRIADERAKRQNILSIEGVDAKSVLQAGVMDKAMKQIATHGYLQLQNGQKPEQYDHTEDVDDTDSDDIYNNM
ncbi:MAG: Mu transposase C-terminal domain-containing protein [Flavipsychrobacter sp.]